MIDLPRQTSEEALQALRPSCDVLASLGFILEQLLYDDVHRLDELVTDRVTYRDLIGALVQADETIAQQ